MNARKAKAQRKLMPPIKGRPEEQDWGRCTRCREWKRGPWLHIYAGNDPDAMHKLPPVCMACGELITQHRTQSRPEGYTAILDLQDEAHPEWHTFTERQ